jgi:hypothetical protein
MYFLARNAHTLLLLPFPHQTQAAHEGGTTTTSGSLEPSAAKKKTLGNSDNGTDAPLTPSKNICGQSNEASL